MAGFAGVAERRRGAVVVSGPALGNRVVDLGELMAVVAQVDTRADIVQIADRVWQSAFAVT